MLKTVVAAGALVGILITGSLTADSPGAFADEEPRVDCENLSGNTHEINVCSERDYAAADAKLNAVWKNVLAHVSENGGEAPWDAKSWEETLRASQRAWVAFRDADCKDAVPMEWTGGTGTTAAVLGCLTEKTRARTKDLETRFGLE